MRLILSQIVRHSALNLAPLQDRTAVRQFRLPKDVIALILCVLTLLVVAAH